MPNTHWQIKTFYLLKPIPSSLVNTHDTQFLIRLAEEAAASWSGQDGTYSQLPGLVVMGGGWS